jgi:hypothetical protein
MTAAVESGPEVHSPEHLNDDSDRPPPAHRAVLGADPIRRHRVGFWLVAYAIAVTMAFSGNACASLSPDATDPFQSDRVR